ncbi:MAG: hypothetical protein KC931_24215, partial [Candidatus Omnitrophica bacterium]|nr:hypothetical protein [Candidatus Omnitrophota bacterium]
MEHLKSKAVGLSIVVLVALLWPMGCDRAALQYPPPQQFTWDPARGENPISVKNDAGTLSSLEKEAAVSSAQGGATRETETLPTNWVATANIHSDVRTNRTLIKGPAEPPDSERFNEIALQ